MRSRWTAWTQVFLAFFVGFVLLLSMYFQYVNGLEPCPLCYMQRLCLMMLFGLVVLTACCLKKPRAMQRMLLLQWMFAVFGLYFSSRQWWLQSWVTPDYALCLPGLTFVLRYFQWQDLLPMFLWGSATCAAVEWRGLGLSMAAWSTLVFVFILAVIGQLLIKLWFYPVNDGGVGE